jgi:preprotein translocase subunit SecA
VLEYDDVMNRQRELIYGQRMEVLEGKDIQDSVMKMVSESIAQTVSEHAGDNNKLERLGAEQLAAKYTRVFIAPEETTSLAAKLDGMHEDDATELLQKRAFAVYAAKEEALGAPILRELERVVLLRVVDMKWMAHIDAMHELRRGIGLNAYAQVDPVVEYKKLGFEMFDEMIQEIRNETARLIFVANVSLRREKVAKENATSGDGTLERKPVKKGQKVGRNDPCPCGSGKKYKHCCGK